MYSDDMHFVMPTGSTSLAGGAIADFANGGTVSDTVCMEKYKTAYFIFHWGVGATGKLTFTALPVPTVGGVATTAIPFQYKRMHTTEINTAWAWATANSLATTLGSEQIYALKVSAADLPLVSGVKYEYVYIDVAETTAVAFSGGCIIIMADPRIAEATTDAVTT